MAHECPECGQWCYCCGDWDDALVYSHFSDCTHCAPGGPVDDWPADDDDDEPAGADLDEEDRWGEDERPGMESLGR